MVVIIVLVSGCVVEEEHGNFPKKFQGSVTYLTVVRAWVLCGCRVVPCAGCYRTAFGGF